MFSLSPEHLAIAALFTLYHGIIISVIVYLLTENRELKRELRESTKVIRDIASIQEVLLRQDTQPAPDLQFDSSALDEPKLERFSETPLPLDLMPAT